ncbi:MAG: sulfotransferase [Parvibaculaceae bacterium]|nr:sulfotransferase [Parvibaculaceae bacterium]
MSTTPIMQKIATIGRLVRHLSLLPIIHDQTRPLTPESPGIISPDVIAQITGALSDKIETMTAKLEGMSAHEAEPSPGHSLSDEIAACRQIAERCIFILGHARSGTTILAECLNAHPDVYMTTEANFYLRGPQADFREQYNLQHAHADNQISKSSYAPAFVPHGSSLWWEWLESAASHYSIVGDKMAFSDVHFDLCSEADFLSFFEARFYQARYLFTFRDPVQTLISTIKLLDKDPIRAIHGWLSMVKLWADFIRIFPHTKTVILDNIGAQEIVEIGHFFNLDTSMSGALLDPREQRSHAPGDLEKGHVLEPCRDRLQSIFEAIKATLTMNPVLFQADQKMGHVRLTDDQPNAKRFPIAVVETPVGKAWRLADELEKSLRDAQMTVIRAKMRG